MNVQELHSRLTTLIKDGHGQAAITAFMGDPSIPSVHPAELTRADVTLLKQRPFNDRHGSPQNGTILLFGQK